MNIVVVDDDSSHRLYLSAILERMGHRVRAVASGDAALTALEETNWQLLLCDVQMPIMDGMELARAVRSRDWGHYIYLLMITGLCAEEDHRLGLEAGADDFMSKPVDSAVLAARLKSAERLIAYEQEINAKNSVIDRAYKRIKDDLRIAAAAQLAFLPPARQIVGKNTISSLLLPSSEISGDIFSAFELRGGGCGLFAADASGHGIKAALSAVALGYMVTEEFFAHIAYPAGSDTAAPDNIARVLDNRFGAFSFEDSYLTMMIAVIDDRRDQIIYCQAGYPSPILLPAGGDLQIIGGGGLPIGLVPNATYERCHTDFKTGDRLLIYSDGVIEAINLEGEEFGIDRLCTLVLLHRNDSSETFFDSLRRALQDWTTHSSLEDDVTLILIDKGNNDAHIGVQ